MAGRVLNPLGGDDQHRPADLKEAALKRCYRIVVLVKHFDVFHVHVHLLAQRIRDAGVAEAGIARHPAHVILRDLGADGAVDRRPRPRRSLVEARSLNSGWSHASRRPEELLWEPLTPQPSDELVAYAHLLGHPRDGDEFVLLWKGELSRGVFLNNLVP